MYYRLYHDESKRSGYWHGMLLVPEISRYRLLTILQEVRSNTRCADPLGIKRIRRASGRLFCCAQSWVLLGVGFMRTKTGTTPYHVHFGKRKRGRLILHTLQENLGLKFILFREKGDHRDMRLLDRYADKVETTFRIGLKGGLHFLSSEDQPIHITHMHFDGNEHHRRGVDPDRIVGRLTGLKNSCSVIEADDLIDDRSSNHNRHDCQHYDDCQLLQLTDLLVGSFRTFLGECTRDVHRQLCHAARLPIEAFSRGPAGFKNSRWFSSFCMSQCEIVKGRWVFSTLEPINEDSASQPEIGI